MDFRPGDALFGNGGVGSLTGVRVSIETIDFEIRRKYIPPLLTPVIRLANRSRPHMTNPHPQLVQIASSFEPGGKKRRHGHWFPHLPLILTWMLKDKPQAATVNSTRTTPNLRSHQQPRHPVNIPQNTRLRRCPSNSLKTCCGPAWVSCATRYLQPHPCGFLDISLQVVAR